MNTTGPTPAVARSRLGRKFGRKISLRAGLGAVLGAGLIGIAALPAAPTPWPYGSAPRQTDLQGQIEDALVLATRERNDELTGTKSRLEAVEATEMLQSTLDRGGYTPEELFLFGDAFFAHEFQRESGLGDADGAKLQRVHRGLGGGLDTYSCAGCHSVGGLDGAGTFAQNALVFGDGHHASSAAPRNAPSLLGVGLVQALAAEMTNTLQAARDRGLSAARASGASETVALQAKGVSFGTLVVHPDGSVDTRAVEGVSPDLVVRPFGWKGDTARLRRMVEEAARIHFGAQSTVLAERHRAAPDPARLGEGPDWYDPDGDGVDREVEEGTLTANAAYLAMLEAPAIVPPSSPELLQRWARGEQRLAEVGCLGCHTRSLHLDQRIWYEYADNPDSPPVSVALFLDGEHPKGDDEVMLFSDLKRHDLGPDLADSVPHPLGIAPEMFLTRPLWGVAETAPYLHDGSAPTLHAAILAHAGEAQASRAAYLGLDAVAQADLQIYLLSLGRAPRVRVAR